MAIPPVPDEGVEACTERAVHQRRHKPPIRRMNPEQHVVGFWQSEG